MTTPGESSLGDPRHADRDGVIPRAPEFDEAVKSDPPAESSPQIIDYAIDHEAVHGTYEPLIIDIPPTRHREPRRMLQEWITVAGLSHSARALDYLNHRIVPQADGSQYAREAFGGFGPSSPEYDHERRLTIVVPNAKSAVTWFRDAEIENGHSHTSKLFTVNLPEALHPGVKQLAVEFTKTPNTSVVAASINPHGTALNIPAAPTYDESGAEFNTYAAAKKLLAEHLADRLDTTYPGMVARGKDDSFVIKLSEDMLIHIEAWNLPYLQMAINGKAGLVRHRFGSAKPTLAQLKRELLVMQEHFPVVAEAYADFFRQQLPKTQIEVDYSSDKSAEKTAHDPVNPDRMAQLRHELIVQPREDDFKYIGGLDSPIEKLQEAALGFSHPEAFRTFGVEPPRGILLLGPPGVGKTSLAMAFARDAEAVVLNVKASTIKSAFHGETERNIRGAFQLADELIAEGERVVIFMDELEALAPARDSFGASNIDKNVTTELLQGMNVDRRNCVIIAATNVPKMVDPALLNNSSRFSQQLEIGLPDTDGRADILQKLFLKFTDKSSGSSRDVLFDAGIQIDTLAHSSEGLSGADIENAFRSVLFTKAVMLATTGQKPGPATNGELYQSIKNIILTKEKATKNYL